MKYIPLVFALFLATWGGSIFATEDETTNTESSSESVESVRYTDEEAPAVDRRLQWTLMSRQNKSLNTQNFKDRYGRANDDSDSADQREERRMSRSYGRRRVETKTKRDKTDWQTNIKTYRVRAEGQTRSKTESTKKTMSLEERLQNRRVLYFQKRRFVDTHQNTEE